MTVSLTCHFFPQVRTAPRVPPNEKRQSKSQQCEARRLWHLADRQAVVRTRGDGHEVVARRHVRLPVAIVAPADQRTVGLQRQAVVRIPRRWPRSRCPPARSSARSNCMPQPASEPSDFSARLWNAPRRWPRSRCPPARSSARSHCSPSRPANRRTSAPGCEYHPAEMATKSLPAGTFVCP